MMEPEYQIEDLPEGFKAIVRSDGAAIGVSVFDIVFELFRQNPKFFETWIELAQDYLLIAPEIGEA